MLVHCLKVALEQPRYPQASTALLADNFGKSGGLLLRQRCEPIGIASGAWGPACSILTYYADRSRSSGILSTLGRGKDRVLLILQSSRFTKHPKYPWQRRRRIANLQHSSL